MFSAQKSRGNASRVFARLEGCWTLAGGNTPGNRPVTLRPERAPESTPCCPISPIGPIRPIPSPHLRPLLTLNQPLIRAENGLRSTPSPTCYKPIIRPGNKGIRPKSNHHRPKDLLALPFIRVGKTSPTQMNISK